MIVFAATPIFYKRLDQVALVTTTETKEGEDEGEEVEGHLYFYLKVFLYDSLGC